MKILLIPNHTYEAARNAAFSIQTWANSMGGSAEIVPDWRENPEVSLDGVTLAVALGGDGTVLRAARIVGTSGIPLLGLRFGNLGFLTAADASDDYLKLLEDVLAGEAHITPRTMIEAVTYSRDTDGNIHENSFIALNEVAITRGGSGRVISFDLSINDVEVTHLRGDGVVIASATGSTGYALSAGGPVVSPAFRGLICVPIAPHTLKARAILTDPSDVVEIDLTRKGPSDRIALADGIPCEYEGLLERVVIKRTSNDLKLISASHESFYEAVSHVFFGGDYAR